VSTKAQSELAHNSRLGFIDALRGLAVIFMIFYHTAESWIDPALRTGAAWKWIRAVGGYAAPLFLFLAGASLVMSVQGQIRRGGAPGHYVTTNVARGLELMLLGYVLRLQMWLIDGGGAGRVGGWIGALFLAGGYFAAYQGLARIKVSTWKSGASHGLWFVGLAAIGFVVIGITAPGHFVRLLRVDVLQAIGASLALVTLGCAAFDFSRKPYLAFFFGSCIAIATPLVRELVPGPFPVAIAAYLAWWDPGPGQIVPAVFPLFPWAAYAFIGAGFGVYWDRGLKQGHLLKTLGFCGVAGLLTIVVTYEGNLWHFYREWPFFVQPLRVLFRVGVVLFLAAVACGLAKPAVQRFLPLHYFGEASLLVYWVHLEFAYGVAARAIVRSLSYFQWLGGSALLIGAMGVMAWYRVTHKKPAKSTSHREITAFAEREPFGVWVKAPDFKTALTPLRQRDESTINRFRREGSP
jgi:uncharacterized membrane protein